MKIANGPSDHNIDPTAYDVWEVTVPDPEEGEPYTPTNSHTVDDSNTGPLWDEAGEEAPCD